MATLNRNYRERGTTLGNTPYGNLVALRYVLKTASNGSAVGFDSSAAIANGDVVNIGILPAGMRLVDSEVIVKTGMTATITGKLGFKYVDGVDSTDVPQDDDYFGTGLDIATAARLRNATTNPSVALPKDAHLTLTTAVANNAKASEIEVVIFAISEGVK